MKFRKKPVVIEAFQWAGDVQQDEHPQWIVDAIKREKVWFVGREIGELKMMISTLEGTHQANRGDWIIQGIKGELYPCKPDIFEATYEAVTE